MKVNYDSWESSALLSLLADNKLLNGFDGVKREIENISSEVEAGVRVGEELISMLEKSISNLRGAIKDLQSEVAALKSKLASVPRTETVKKQVPDGSGNMKTVTETHSINQGLISQLNAEIAEKDSEIQSLECRVDRLESMKAEAEHVISELSWCNGSSGGIEYARSDIERKRNSFREDLDKSKKHVRYASECMERYNHVSIYRDGYHNFPKIPSKRG
ncbi:MAG: hypothetical protein K2N23_00235 [Clostridia bacterium]|nr:hypothetical protein [Clostridia bacterium]